MPCILNTLYYDNSSIFRGRYSFFFLSLLLCISFYCGSVTPTQCIINNYTAISPHSIIYIISARQHYTRTTHSANSSSSASLRAHCGERYTSGLGIYQSKEGCCNKKKKKQLINARVLFFFFLLFDVVVDLPRYQKKKKGKSNACVLLIMPRTVFKFLPPILIRIFFQLVSIQTVLERTELTR